MGLLDKVKANGGDGHRGGQGRGRQGTGEATTRSQAKKAADGMLRDLGAAFYATKTGRATPDHRRRYRAAGGGPAVARVGARPPHAGARVRRGRADGDPAGTAPRLPHRRHLRPRPPTRPRHPLRRRPHRRSSGPRRLRSR